MWQRLKVWFAYLISHRTKALGIAAVAVAYGQNNLGQLGHVLPAHWQGVLLGAFGVAAFCIGLINTLAGLA